MQCAIRIPANESLERDIVELLARPVGRPSQKTGGQVQGAPIPYGELEDVAAGGSEGGVPVGGDVLPSPIHRDQPGGRTVGLLSVSTPWNLLATSEARRSNGSKKASRR